jgi:hypothetical protein
MGKFRTGLSCSIGAAVVALSCAYANSAISDAPENRSPDLLERIASLENRVAELERRLIDQTLVRYQRAATITPDPIILRPPAPAASPAPPGIRPGLTPQHFNGATYYIVPLTNETAE